VTGSTIAKTTFREPSPEGQYYDPDGYGELVAYRRKILIAGAVVLAFMIPLSLSSIPTRSGEFEFPVGTIILGVVIGLIFSGFGFYYIARLKSHEKLVIYGREARMKIQRDELLETRKAVTETKAIVTYQDRVNNVVNNVTLNFSNGSSFTGPLTVGKSIEVSYIAAADTKDEQLKEALESLVRWGTKLAEEVSPDKNKNAVSTQLKTMVEESKKDKPDSNSYLRSARQA